MKRSPVVPRRSPLDLISFIGGIWSVVKGLLESLLGIVMDRRRCDDDSLSDLVLSYLLDKYKRTVFGKRFYTDVTYFIRPEEKVRRVAMEDANMAFQIFWIGHTPLFFFKPGDRQFSFFKGTIDFPKILNDALDWAHELEQNSDAGNVRYAVHHIFGSVNDKRPNIIMKGNDDSNEVDYVSGDHDCWLRTSAYVPQRWNFDCFGPLQSADALDQLSLLPQQLDLIDEIKFWHSAEEWYKKHGVPWRRGYLLYGPPGTGKTSLSRALAEELDMPVYVYDLTSMSNSDLIREWQSMLEKTPCIALLEDIDTVFHGRESVSKVDGGLTFECLLNCLDGIERCNGLLTFVTTNCIEHLDPALGNLSADLRSTRPGRIDRAVHFSGMDHEGRVKLALRIVEDPIEAERLAIESKDDTAAQLQERCVQSAISKLYAKRKTTT